jgi:hypothetical protein
MRPWPLLLLPAFTFVSVAQNSAAKPATGTVTGHVYCADTNAPARMVSVQLKPVKDAEARPGASPHSNPGEPASGVVQTTLDGSFAIPNVSPGSYYVIVTAAGYLSPPAHDDDTDDAKPEPSPAGQPPIVVPKVDVQADQTASIDIRIERGAAVSGTVRFDDGSPAAGVIVVVLHKSKDKWVSSPTGDYGAFAMPSSLVTDDLGHYRTGGLRDREYILQATLFHMDLMPAGAHGSGLSGTLRNSLAVYSGDAMRRSDAVPFKLSAGEERTGEDITIPLSKLHSISGIVTAVSDGHPINSGHLTLEDPTDKESVVDADIGSDGTFHLEGVPEGSYTLRIQNARDRQVQEVAVGGERRLAITNEKILHQYSDLEQTFKVEGDMSNLALSVPEETAQHAAALE